MPMAFAPRLDGPDQKRAELELSTVARLNALISSQAAVVDVYGPKCPPCKAFEPILLSTAKNNPGVKFGMLDGNAHPDLEEKVNSALRERGLADYGVRFYPTQVLFSNGKAVAIHEGKFSNEQEFALWIKNGPNNR